MSSTSYGTVSLMLSRVLEDVGVTEEMVNRRRTTFMEKEANANFSQMLLGLSTISFYFGSQSEATTTLGMNSDTDSLSYMNKWPVILNMDDWTKGKNNLLLLRDQFSFPQHCYLQRINSESKEPMKNLPVSDHVTDSTGRVLIKNTYFINAAQRYEKRVNKKFVEHGPSISYSDMIDFVFCFHCTKIPSVCKVWVNRNKRNHWPSENVKEMALNGGIFLMPQGHPESDHSIVEWRFSTSATERLIMFGLNLCQLKVFILLKLIRKTYLQKIVDDRLSSYHLKTAVLYTVENYPLNEWREDNIIQCTIYCLRTLAGWLHQNYLPHYCIAGVNLLVGKLKKQELPMLLNVIQNMIDTKLQCILGIQIDSLGDRFSTMLLRGWYSSTQFACKEKVERGIIADLCEQYFGGLNESLNNFMAAANKVSFEQAYKTINTNLKSFAVYLNTKDQIRHDALILFIKYQSSVIATMHVTRSLKAGLAIMMENTGDLFNMSMDFDIASVKLKLASVCYCMKQYTKATDILAKVVSSFQPYVMSACNCRTQMKPSTAFKRKARGSTTQDTLKSSVAFCVKFLRHEKECVPKHLVYEMYRAARFEDLKLRDPWNDVWMDMAVVEALPLAYYLQYLTFRELGLEEERIDSILKLVDYMETYNGYGHIETVCNLVGNCYELEGLYDQALGWYVESLRAFPRNNAAIWHITLLLYGLYKEFS